MKWRILAIAAVVVVAALVVNAFLVWSEVADLGERVIAIDLVGRWRVRGTAATAVRSG